MQPSDRTTYEELVALLRHEVGLIVQRKGLEVELDDDENLFAPGLLDSVDFVMLVAAVGDRFGLTPDFSERDPEEFQTIAGFARCALGGADTQ